ncbi:hypothetical protein Leryth_022490 [Lithospermum erythrorhizon]|nr:hypothetical protein Leryth_022490 [Lithospermum erythrorhizon]
MKHNYRLLVSLVFSIFFSFSSLALSQFLGTSNNIPVLDTDGHELQTSSKYLIVPAQSSKGGGLSLGARDRACPFYVMQENQESKYGLPIKLMPVDNKQRTIILSSDLNIVFSAATICVQSTVWRLGNEDEVTGARYVISGGVMGRPGADTVSNWFRIERQGNGFVYRIVFCPSVCSTCKVVCGNVGVFSENGKRWLGLSDNPILVTFKNVSS